MFYIAVYKIKYTFKFYFCRLFFVSKGFMLLDGGVNLYTKAVEISNQIKCLKYSTDFLYIFTNAVATYTWLFFFNSVFFRLVLICLIMWL